MSGVPFGAFGFKVEIETESGAKGCFQEVSGLSVQVNVTDLVEGGVNNTTHKLIGNASYSNITLKRGLCDGSMFDWISRFVNYSGGGLKRVNGTIKILDDAGKVAKTYLFKNAVPVKWDGPALSVMQDAIATESLELAHEGLTQKNG